MRLVEQFLDCSDTTSVIDRVRSVQRITFASPHILYRIQYRGADFVQLPTRLHAHLTSLPSSAYPPTDFRTCGRDHLCRPGSMNLRVLPFLL